MLKGSKLQFFGWAVIAFTLLLFGFKVDKISDRLQEKINSAIQGTFEVEDFSMDLMEVKPDLNGQTPSELGGDNLFEITSDGTSIGYVYVGVAPSLKKTFDYVVLFTPELSVKKSKILIYREDHGRQVGSQRWLKQFIGKKSGETLVYGEDIDGISGATVSAKSMTLAVSNVLESIQVLKDADFF
ncbi:FMN-binding protein [Muricauda sp. TY007]|uniref:FMN-binding protein n=1 Tax=Allomuricauda sp. TY007 TaxID=2683200 RepID=UPI0013BF9898|nr:FMN-binding protein [Muricauda sp. TY007]NDV16827.1 FMN-binding protein [Muricauda sp. TY007]